MGDNYMRDIMEIRDDIRATVTMDDVLHRLGQQVPRDRKIPSIYKDERTPSLHVYKYDYFDFSTGQGGDVIRFVMDSQHFTFRRAIEWLAGGADELTPTRTVQKKEIVDLSSVFEDVANCRNPGVWHRSGEYVRSRWPTLSLLDVLDLGSKLTPSGALWTPHHDDAGRIVGIKVRDTATGRKRSVLGSTFRERLYHPRARSVVHSYPGSTAYIVEGESDSWVLFKFLYEANGYSGTVFALPSGAGLWRDVWRRQLEPYQRIRIIMDNDDAGNAAAERITGSLLSEVTARSRVVERVMVPEGSADLADAVALGGAAEWLRL